MEEQKQNRLEKDDDFLDEAVDLLIQMKRINKRKGYHRLLYSINHKSGKRRMLHVVLKVAAVVLPLAIGGIAWWNMAGIETPKNAVEVAKIMPGSSKACLYLDGGQMVMLDTFVENRQIAEDHGVEIHKNEKSLVYSNDSILTDKPVKMAYNRLEVPRGGEFNIVLQDGTEVWLNADSRLIYPVAFHGKERVVTLEGEAFFVVKRDTARPFFVVSGDQKVRVLGTEFNVCAYPDESLIYTTLIKGRVAVEVGNRQLTLQPGEQAVMDVNDKTLNKQPVNVDEFVGWRKNMFVFEDQNLEQIMAKLTRWYDVKVFYRNEEAKNIIFKGNLPRYAEFSTILEIIEKSSDVKFEVKDHVVTVNL
ncbi:FecR family protein [Butyricimonas paravirosa]|uniref:FecR family protein n=1 Tax=Butyricimonas paravirosa TaxID=1472417 RepID=UPI00210CBFC8|nr:FecR family protein [Butyricimonas paravirosa]MCQ4873548.1 DUF4974 domain-containing protein [Butyricimonas paravirosa]